MIAAFRSSRDFRLLVGGELISRSGTAASFVAVWAVAVYELEVNAQVLSLLMLANTVPRVLASWAAGRLVDRFGPRLVLLVANVVGCVGSLLQWASDGAVQLGLATLIAGAGFGAFLPAIQSMAPRVVDDHHLLSANAILELTWQIGFIIGPLVGAVAIELGGVRAPLLFDATTFAVAILWLLPVRLRPRTDAADDGSVDLAVRGFLPGLRYVWSLAVARYVTVLNTGSWVGISIFIVLEPIYVARVLDAGPAVLGILQTFFGVGAVVGSVLASRNEERAGPSMMAWTTALCGVAMIGYGGTRSLVVASIGVAVWGVGLGWTMPVGRTLLQRGVPMSRHGLANGVQSTLQSLGEVIPVLAAGQLVALVGVRPSLVGAGVWTIGLATWGFYAARRLRFSPATAAGVPPMPEPPDPAPAETSEPSAVPVDRTVHP